jgi:DNA repair protein RadC
MEQAQFKPIRVSYSRTVLKALVWKLKDVEDMPQGFARRTIKSPGELFKDFNFLFKDLAVEQFVVFVMSSAKVVQCVDIISTGLLNASLVHPREVFRAAIVGCGASIIVAHNHPSGNLEPSQEDITITRQIVEAGKIINIPVEDHLIFTDTSYTSFAERGLL